MLSILTLNAENMETANMDKNTKQYMLFMSTNCSPKRKKKLIVENAVGEKVWGNR